jgi:hypothetical protein
MKNFTFFIVTIIALSFFSCKKETTENALQFNTIEYTSTPEDSIVNNFSYDINISYPTSYSNDSILQLIQQDILFITTNDSLPFKSSVKESIEEYITRTKTDWKTSLDEFKRIRGNEKISFSSQLIIKAEPAYADSSILSYKSTVYSYTGGAHGITVITYRSYDLKNGKALSESDIFEVDYNEFLSNCILKNLEQNCLDSNCDIQQYYLDKVVPNGNFYLNDKGITYLFNQYEIAAYAYGQTEIFIPYSDIISILKEDSPIAYLFNKK